MNHFYNKTKQKVQHVFSWPETPSTSYKYTAGFNEFPPDIDEMPKERVNKRMSFIGSSGSQKAKKDPPVETKVHVNGRGPPRRRVVGESEVESRTSSKGEVEPSGDAGAVEGHEVKIYTEVKQGQLEGTALEDSPTVSRKIKERGSEGTTTVAEVAGASTAPKMGDKGLESTRVVVEGPDSARTASREVEEASESTVTAVNTPGASIMPKERVREKLLSEAPLEKRATVIGPSMTPKEMELQEKLGVSEARRRALREQMTVDESKMKEVLKHLGEVETDAKELKSRADEANGQVAKLLRQLSDARKDRTTITSLENQLKKRDTELEQFRRDKQESVSTISALRSQLKQATDFYQSTKAANDSMNSTIRDLNSQIQTRDTDLKKLKIRCENQSLELQRVKEKHAADQLLLQHRTKELQEAQTYLTSIRASSGADIIRLVESLNEEILQTAASITDALPLDEAVSMTANAESGGVVERELLPLIGEEAMAALVHRPTIDDLDTVIHSCLQMVMVFHCVSLITSWSLEEPKHKFLAGIYERIRKKDRPSVAGRWRAMTKMQTKYEQYDEFENRTRDVIFDQIRAIVAGWVQDKEHEAQIAKIIDQKLRVVLSKAIMIDRILGVDVVVEDWEVFCAFPGSPCDHENVDDAFRNPRDSEETESLVVCPTHLGCRRKEETVENESEGWQVMLKAKALLDTAFKR